MREEAVQIRISDIIHSIVKSRILIISLTLAGLVAGIVLSIISYMRGEMSKEYEITTSIAVTSQNKDGLFTSQMNNPNSTDIYLAENMVDSVIYVLKSDQTLNAAVDKLNLVGISTQDIYNNLVLKQYNETQIIEIALYWRSAEEGVQILKALTSVARKILIDTLKLGDVSVVNDPKASYRLGGNVNASMWLYMAMLGLMAGIGLSVLRLLLMPTLLNSYDMEKHFGLEVLAEIPENRKYFAQKHSLLVEDEEDIGNDVRESFISAAHILSHRLTSEKNKCFYVTSAVASEGKTNVVANLGVRLSDMEKKVLLIDFDVRNPSLGSLFLEKVDYRHSLNALYRGDATENEAITVLSGYLDLLPSILERRELPMDDAMLDLIRKLSVKYDYVLMDAAPIGQVADTMNLNRLAGTALFVVRYDSTNLNDIREALIRLDKSGIRLIGCVINAVRSLGTDKYQYYKGSYGIYGSGSSTYSRRYGTAAEDVPQNGAVKKSPKEKKRPKKNI